MGKTELTKNELELIIENYKKGIEINIIAKQLNISNSCVYYQLKKLNIKSNRKSTNNYKHNIVGKKFGYLNVIKIERNKNSTKSSPFRAICKCDCGKICDISTSSLMASRTTSCGCRRDQYNKTRGKNSKMFKGCEEISGHYWYQINRRAKKRGYNIMVSIEFAWGLFIKQEKKCALSGVELNFSNSNKPSSETTASLDRIDSNIGYVEGNVQWVHKTVNIMKNVFEQKYFIEMCKLITENNK